MLLYRCTNVDVIRLQLLLLLLRVLVSIILPVLWFALLSTHLRLRACSTFLHYVEAKIKGIFDKICM